MGTAALVVWPLVWCWFPRSQPPRGQARAFFAHYWEVGSQSMVWYVLATNTCQQMGFFGMFGYLGASLMQTYHLPTAATALPLALAGMGVMEGSILGGRVADHPRRVALFALSCWGKGFALRRHSRARGLLAALVFTAQVSPWITVALACGAAALARVSSAVTPTLLLELAGNSRTTATGLFTMSNQLGVFGGAALGGLMLAWGGFPWVGLFCLAVAVIAAVVIHLKGRDSAALLAQMALRKSIAAPE